MDFVEFKNDEIWEEDEENWSDVVEDDWGDTMEIIDYVSQENNEKNKLLTDYEKELSNQNVEINYISHKNVLKIFIGFKIKKYFTCNEIKYFNLGKFEYLTVYIGYGIATEVLYECGLSNDNRSIKSFNLSWKITERLKNDFIFSLESNFFVFIVDYIQELFKHIYDKCLVCDGNMKYVAMKPYICEKEICHFRYNTLNLGFLLLEEIRRDPIVADLLISFFYIACNAPRELTYKPDNFNKTKMIKILNDCPTIYDLIELENEQTLKKHIGPELYNILCWIITSNRVYLEYKSDSNNEYTFVMNSSNPEKEAKFNNHVRKNTETYPGYHGSGINNWHNIIRMGLKNYSGTKWQLNGAAYGKGIYLSKNIQTAKSYAGIGHRMVLKKNDKKVNWSNSIFENPNCYCSATICKDGKNTWYNPKAFGGIYVVSKDEFVHITHLTVINNRIKKQK